MSVTGADLLKGLGDTTAPVETVVDEGRVQVEENRANQFLLRVRNAVFT
jgi:hypothetical protein